MRHSIKTYSSLFAQALSKAPTAKEKKLVIDNFIQLLKNHHSIGSSREIIRSIRHILKRKFGIRTASITTARPLHANITTTLTSILPPDSHLEFKTDPACIGGIRILLDDELLIDSTLEQKVNSLFGR